MKIFVNKMIIKRVKTSITDLEVMKGINNS